MAKTYVTRREVEAGRAEIRADLAGLAGRLDAIQGGAGGVGGISVQVAEVIKDLGAMQADVKDFRREHLQLHELEEAKRVGRSRWLVTTLIAGFAASGATQLLGVLIHLHR